MTTTSMLSILIGFAIPSATYAKVEPTRAEFVCTAMLELSTLEERALIRDRFHRASSRAMTLATNRLNELVKEDSGEKIRLDKAKLANITLTHRFEGAPFEFEKMMGAHVRLRKAAWDARGLEDKKVLSRHSIVGRDKILDHLDRLERSIEASQEEYGRASSHEGFAPFRAGAPNPKFGMVRDIATITLASGLALREAALGALHFHYGFPLHMLVDFGTGYLLFNSVLMPRLVGYGQFLKRRAITHGALAPEKPTLSRVAEDQFQQNQEIRAVLEANRLDAIVFHGFTAELPMAYDEYSSGYWRRVAPNAAEIKGATIGRKGHWPPVGPRRLEVDRVLMVDPETQDWTLTEFVREPKYPRESQIVPF